MKTKRRIGKVQGLLTIVLLVQVGLAAAAPGRERPASLTKAWLVNLGDEPARIGVEDLAAKSARAGDLVLDPGAPMEAPEAAIAALGRGPQKARVLVLRTPEGFDPQSLEVELHPAIELERQGDRLVARYKPEGWSAGLMALGEPLPADQTGRAELSAGDTAAVAVALLEADSAVDVVVRNARGEELRSFALHATVPARLRLDLGAIGTEGGRVELHVTRGRAAGTVSSGNGGVQGLSAAATTACSGHYSQHINYNYGTSVTYSVSGCPANVCGEIDTYRNGVWQFTSGWICTDASGNATKGPWLWENVTSEQTDDPTFIRFPDGTTTNNDWHIWDKHCAVTYRDSTSRTPPTNYFGHATDTQWGAGFDFSPFAYSYFQDTTSGMFFDGATGAYSSATSKGISASLSHVNRWYVNWTTVFPPAGAHTSGHTYQWYTCVGDGNCGTCTPYLTFTMP